MFAAKDNNAPCDADQNLCTAGDSCQGGTCRAGTAVDCSAACKQCSRTTGRCDGSNKDNNATCNDGNACTQRDRCNNSGTCVGQLPKTCNPCNACDPADGGCKPAPGSCSDNNNCTTDACSGGQCVGTPKTCNDQNECTSDGCNMASGSCVFTPIPMCPADGGW